MKGQYIVYLLKKIVFVSEGTYFMPDIYKRRFAIKGQRKML